jgi:hypothetical protein
MKYSQMVYKIHKLTKTVNKFNLQLYKHVYIRNV